MKIKYKILVWGILAGLFSLSLSNVHNLFRVSDIVMDSAFYGLAFYPQYINFFIDAYMPLLFFQILMGNYIYQHFCCANIYYFSRMKDRKRWLFNEVSRLYGWALLYLWSYLFIRLLIVAFVQKGITIRLEDIILTVVYLVIHSLFLFSVTLLSNLLSVLTNKGLGFVIVQGFIYLLATAFLLMGSVIRSEEKIVTQYAWLIRYNYLANLFFTLHSCRIQSVNELLAAPDGVSMQFGFLFSLIFYVVILVIVLMFGCVLVSRKEFISEGEI